MAHLAPTLHLAPRSRLSSLGPRDGLSTDDSDTEVVSANSSNSDAEDAGKADGFPPHSHRRPMTESGGVALIFRCRKTSAAPLIRAQGPPPELRMSVFCVQAHPFAAERREIDMRNAGPNSPK